MNDVIMDECELSIAANTIQRNVEKLINAMSQYNQILAGLQKNGIEDDHIRAQLTNIAEEIAFCGEHLNTNISNLGPVVNRGIERVKEEDIFVFPGSFVDEIISRITSMFF